MSEHEARGRAVYDHDVDEPRPSGRRRRPAPDWGVGEELFDHMPRRRFGRERRPGDHHGEPEVPRGGADDGRRTIRIGDEGAEPPPLEAERERDPLDDAFASREEALRAREEDEALWGGDEPFAPDRPLAATDGPPAVADELASLGEPPIRDEPRAPDAASGPAGDDPALAPRASGLGGAQDGRRTVRIGGRPGELGLERPARRRPSRTAGERVGARPDRIAAWAFALGILLILIAVATAAAGVG